MRRWGLLLRLRNFLGETTIGGSKEREKGRDDCR